ncbi:uncharacterized protein BDR25DRAFT_352685 [Lindgomyces ingoldianus]|uniref:Uncharacterized protein n=1 Tax=Lindgomyces ingoldianus TaxID=673940 RepID=A0ACB6R2C8_9PLEO|nr:uncharacterized protein BDR25DRAFT_352685 [Lindgomyces ingoldianus]KAF2473250.1 hypothetical protein BDR25DRAFT_352685 [Lindgomyces ingoldianus]
MNGSGQLSTASPTLQLEHIFTRAHHMTFSAPYWSNGKHCIDAYPAPPPSLVSRALRGRSRQAQTKSGIECSKASNELTPNERVRLLLKNINLKCHRGDEARASFEDAAHLVLGYISPQNKTASPSPTPCFSIRVKTNSVYVPLVLALEDRSYVHSLPFHFPPATVPPINPHPQFLPLLRKLTLNLIPTVKQGLQAIHLFTTTIPLLKSFQIHLLQNQRSRDHIRVPRLLISRLRHQFARVKRETELAKGAKPTPVVRYEVLAVRKIGCVEFRVIGFSRLAENPFAMNSAVPTKNEIQDCVAQMKSRYIRQWKVQDAALLFGPMQMAEKLTMKSRGGELVNVRPLRRLI